MSKHDDSSLYEEQVDTPAAAACPATGKTGGSCVFSMFSRKSGKEEEDTPLPWYLKVVLVPWNVAATWLCAQMFTWLVHDLSFGLDGGFLSPYERQVSWSDNLYVRCAINFCLTLFFGSVHSLFARQFMRDFLIKKLGIVHKRAMRTVFITATGFAYAFQMFCYHHNDDAPLIWDLRPHVLRPLGVEDWVTRKWTPVLSLIFAILCFGTVVQHDYFTFMGLRQLFWKPATEEEKQEEKEKKGLADRASHLVVSGIYSTVRHPMYMYLQLIVLVTPVMKLDRFVYLLASSLFLVLGLPLEEEKLIVEFGPIYRDYQKCVPSFMPLLPMPMSKAAFFKKWPDAAPKAKKE